MTKTQIINETVKYYSEDVTRRAIDACGACSYKTLDARMCAVGRCLKPEENVSLNGSITNLKKEGNKVVYKDALFQEKYQKHEIEFWQDLQGFHDRCDYWNPDGLTRQGEKQLNFLLEEWK